MTRRAYLQYFCVFLLLVAQQGALTHAVWHAHDGHHSHAHEQDGAHEDESPSIQSTLCAFDMAFGQVLGGTHGGTMALAYAPIVLERFHDLTTPRLRAEAVSPKSRGPPALL